MKRFKLNLNSVRVICTLLVIANHTSPFLSYYEPFDFIVTRIVARIAVPFFLMIIGYFSLERLIYDTDALIKYLKRILILYLISVVLYLPITFYANRIYEFGILEILNLFLFDGTLYHLWYFPALILGVLLTILLIKQTKYPFIYITLLYLIGLGGDSYFRLSSCVSIINSFYYVIFSIFSYTRNGFFFVPIFLYLGYWIKQQNKTNEIQNKLPIIITFIGLLAEGLLIRYFNPSKHDSMYIMLIPFMYYFFSYLSTKDNKVNRNLNTLTTYVYITHPLFIVVIRGISKISFLNILSSNSIIFYLIVTALSFGSGYLFMLLKNTLKKGKVQSYQRVYREVNEANLVYNLKQINRFKQKSSEVMAVVKADAYGHGAVKVSQILQKEGVQIFAVATLEEAIELRKNKIKKDILILGYTSLNNIPRVIEYDLTQTIVNYEYAKKIEALNLKKRLKSHIKVNTGMNRLGEEYHNVKLIKEIYEMSCLDVQGIFSHLAVADSLGIDDMKFTCSQIERFDACITQLKNLGVDVKKKHLQGSYGLTNYPHLNYDYIRMGILLYGVKSDINDEVSLDLKPVLTLKSTITAIRTIHCDDCVSYGRTFKADKTMRIASVSIGYGDGLSRSLSNTGFEVLVNDHKCEVIGRICMDQLMIDVSELEEISLEDEVIIFGENNSVEILAQKQNTITNEVLTSLTRRIEHSS